MLHVVLFQPEIAENTGNIIRTCVAFNATLHLIRPYGFFFSKESAKIKRSCANYLDKCTIKEYDSYEEFVNNCQPQLIFYLSRYGKITSKEIKFDVKKDNYIMFGKESTGIDKDILRKNIDKTFRIPTSTNVRSLNVANCVSIIAYQYVSVADFDDLSLTDQFKSI
ncbi:MAG: tRNA (cytidine(34)-2'-O)-methyltransferase [Mycoplasmataceae bacterium]|jgi:tRNA (cytidine/uridine-2'-O-)-methyltransferase|nr:tRNA (cytidine(34)-2'-O)-methyltransferase [Mycoplasmataceae bacterium]